MPGRLKQVVAAEGEDAVPYLRPYDVFEYLPIAASSLATARTPAIDAYRIQPGTILQTRSGRNLGPAAMVDESLARFVLSDDMIRVAVDDERLRGYVHAYLSTPTGQAMMRQRISGSIIDHLTVEDVEILRLVFIPDGDLRHVSDLMNESESLIGRSRETLFSLLATLDRRYPMPERSGSRRDGWSASAAGLLGGARLDAHYHDPYVAVCRDQMEQVGGVKCGDIAQAILPPRYKRYYVGADYGRPILSGRQLLQIHPISLRHISDRSFSDPDVMVLTEGMVAFGAVGRWEGRLGVPVLITQDRAGWLASNDVMRLKLRDNSVEPAWLWLALACRQVQEQVSSLPHGSVVDHTAPNDIENRVVLPPIDIELAVQCRKAWDDFDKARRLRSLAVQGVESAIAHFAD